MTDNSSAYSLTILETAVDQAQEPAQLTVRYQGLVGPMEIAQPLSAVDVDGLLSGCEAVARRIFRDEFRLNSAVELSFTLADENGMKIWHTQPTLYMKCPLTMAMKWSCSHLSDVYKTMTTLGVIELPGDLPLNGNSVNVNATARVIMDSMGSGVEFMGNIMLMRQSIDHESEKRRGELLAKS
jgi:hypothetical protein